MTLYSRVFVPAVRAGFLRWTAQRQWWITPLTNGTLTGPQGLVGFALKLAALHFTAAVWQGEV